MNILITGGSGFIGANFIEYMVNKYPQYNFINVDLLTYAGNNENLDIVEGCFNYKFYQGDICNRKLLEELFEKYSFEGVIHFAAESHVDNSISNPNVFIETNINGTFTLLDIAYKYWMDAPHKNKKNFGNARFHHISTDEVYGSLGEKGYFTELSPYAPNSPYSASKAASDMLVRSYFHTYGLNVVTTNCSNNYGPKQHNEKLIPTIIRKAMAGETIPVYGDGRNVRDWLFVLDHCNAIDKVFHEGKAGETYVVGGNNELTNLEIAEDICGILDVKCEHLLKKYNIRTFKELINFVADRAGHDYRYAIDAKKIKNTLEWKPNTDFEVGLNLTIDWYLKQGL